MRKLDLTNYEFTQKVQNPVKAGVVDEFRLPYMVKDSILNIMFLPQMGLRGAELIKQNVLAIKIDQAVDFVILEEEEYERICGAIEKYVAQSRADVQLVDRILNQTPEITLEEAAALKSAQPSTEG